MNKWNSVPLKQAHYIAQINQGQFSSPVALIYCNIGNSSTVVEHSYHHHKVKVDRGSSKQKLYYSDPAASIQSNGGDSSSVVEHSPPHHEVKKVDRGSSKWNEPMKQPH